MVSIYCLTFLLLSYEHCDGKPADFHPDETKPHEIKSNTGLASCSSGQNQCVFPFKFNNRIITSCTTIDGDTTPWCATAVNRDEKMTAWGYCHRECPGVKDVEMFIHPDNAVGSCGMYYVYYVYYFIF
jgi:hypothetical protein